MFRLVEAMLHFATKFQYFPWVRNIRKSLETETVKDLGKDLARLPLGRTAIEKAAIQTLTSVKLRLRFQTCFNEPRINNIAEFVNANLVPIVMKQEIDYIEFTRVLEEAKRRLF